MSQEKISVYNLADLKNTSDDAISNYLNSLNFTQSHRLTDVRLALGYGALAVAGACFVWDLKLGFDSTKYYSAAAVAIYMLLNAALTYWARAFEGATVYVGTAPSGETIAIATSTEKYTPVYNVEITITDKAAPGKAKAAARRALSLSRPFSDWFDSAGSFVAAPFQSMLATAVPAIGQADPKRVATATATSAPAPAPGRSSQPPAYSAAMLDVLAAAHAAGNANGSGAASSTTATEPAGKKGGKRRKA